MPLQSICSIPDCANGRRLRRGWCEMHYGRWRRHGDPLVTLTPSRITGSVVERFWAKVDRRGPDDCWLWTGADNGDGYGRFRAGDKLVRAHRWVYEHEVGPIPDGLTIDHLCRTPSCVNVRHMEPVTLRENVLRGIGPPAINARKTHCVRGHEFTVENTSVEPDGSRRCRECVRAAGRRWRPRRKLVAGRAR